MDAKCIIFTHGLCANHTMFHNQVSQFRAHYTVITWDIPLHGQSRIYEDFSFVQVTEDLNLILEQEGVSRAVLVGMSLGGYLCQLFAESHPEKILGFVALDTTPLDRQYYSTFDRWLLGRVVCLAKALPDAVVRKVMAGLIVTKRQSYEFMMTLFEEFSHEEVVALMDIAYKEFCKGSHGVAVEFPVLILLGSQDKTGKMKQFCRAWAKKEGHPIHYIKHASHFSHGDNPAQVNREIDWFINKLV